MKSWSNKVFFFSSNSISFASLTRTNFLYIHTGNEVEEVLEKQEQERRQEKNRSRRYLDIGNSNIGNSNNNNNNDNNNVLINNPINWLDFS